MVDLFYSIVVETRHNQIYGLTATWFTRDKKVQIQSTFPNLYQIAVLP